MNPQVGVLCLLRFTCNPQPPAALLPTPTIYCNSGSLATKLYVLYDLGLRSYGSRVKGQKFAGLRGFGVKFEV